MMLVLVVWPGKNHSEKTGVWINGTKWCGLMNLNLIYCRVYIRRRVGEDYLPQCVQSTVKL